MIHPLLDEFLQQMFHLDRKKERKIKIDCTLPHKSSIANNLLNIFKEAQNLTNENSLTSKNNLILLQIISLH